MELSSRQLVALGAPVVVVYLTWSAVSGEVAPPPAPKEPAVTTSTASKRPQIGPLARNPFAPAGVGVAADDFAAVDGAAGDTQQGRAPLRLDGTVVTGRWRMAIINGERVFEGQSYHGRRLENVTGDSVTLVPAAGEPLRLQLDVARPQPAPAGKGSGAAGAMRSLADKMERVGEALHTKSKDSGADTRVTEHGGADADAAARGAAGARR